MKTRRTFVAVIKIYIIYYCMKWVGAIHSYISKDRETLCVLRITNKFAASSSPNQFSCLVLGHYHRLLLHAFWNSIHHQSVKRLGRLLGFGVRSSMYTRERASGTKMTMTLRCWIVKSNPYNFELQWTRRPARSFCDHLRLTRSVKILKGWPSTNQWNFFRPRIDA